MAGISHRYLWGPGVDQLLADEATSTPGSSRETRWALGDQLGPVRDIVTYDSGTDSVESLAHRTYDSFGNLTSEQNENAVEILFGYIGRQFDEGTGLQNNLNRWYDPVVGRWVSEDPIGLAGGDANLGRYVSNSSTSSVDQSGLQKGSGPSNELSAGEPHVVEIRPDVSSTVSPNPGSVDLKVVEDSEITVVWEREYTWLQYDSNGNYVGSFHGTQQETAPGPNSDFFVFPGFTFTGGPTGGPQGGIGVYELQPGDRKQICNRSPKPQFPIPPAPPAPRQPAKPPEGFWYLYWHYFSR